MNSVATSTKSNHYSAAVLLIGNEILSGSVSDLNLTHIAKTLEPKGIRVCETRIVQDIEDEIVAALNAMRVKYDFVFTTGGIGPTHDDITSDSVARAFEVKNVVQPVILEKLEAVFEQKNLPLTNATKRMAYAPEGASILHTNDSIIPGYQIDNVFVMAGVPRIMKIMLDACLERLPNAKAILSLKVHANISEGQIANDLEQIEKKYQTIDIGSYPQDIDSQISNYKVVFVIKGVDLDVLRSACNDIVKACQNLDCEAILETQI